MNGNGDNKLESNKHVVLIVALTLCVNGTIGVGTLSYCMVTEKKVDATIFIAFVGIVNYILGVVSGMLLKTSPTQSSPDRTNKTAGTEKPAPVKIEQPPGEPIPVQETPPATT